MGLIDSEQTQTPKGNPVQQQADSKTGEESFLSKNKVPIIIGAVVLVAVIGGVVWKLKSAATAA